MFHMQKLYHHFCCSLCFHSMFLKNAAPFNRAKTAFQQYYFLFNVNSKQIHIRVLTPLPTYRFLYLSCFGSIAYMYILSSICIYRPYGIVAHSVGHYQWRASSEIKRSSAALAWTCQLEMQHDSPRFVMEVQTNLSSVQNNVVTGTKHHLFSIRFIMCVCQAYVKGKMLRHR